MNNPCQIARPYIELLRRIPAADETAEESAARKHFLSCTSCGPAWQRVLASDSVLSAAIRDLPVPREFAEKLVESLRTPASIPVTSLPASQTAHSGMLSRRRMLSRWALAATGTAMAAGGLAWLLWPQSPPSMSTIRDLVAQMLERGGPTGFHRLPAFDGSFDASPPAGWRDWIHDSPRSLLSRSREKPVAAMYSFLVPPDKEVGQVIAGLLAVFPLSSVSDPPQTDRFNSSHAWSQPLPNVAWAERNSAFICFLSDGTVDGMERRLHSGIA